MKVDDINLLNKFTTDFCNIVEKHCKYIIVSGFLSIATGRTRGTEDIDIIIEKLDESKFQKLHQELSELFEVLETDDVKEMYQRLEENSNIRYVYKNELLPNMELKFAKDEIDKKGLNNRIKIPLTELDIWFSPLTLNIAFKETLLDSQKDKEDALHLRELFQEELNEEEIEQYKQLIQTLRQ